MQTKMPNQTDTRQHTRVFFCMGVGYLFLTESKRGKLRRWKFYESGYGKGGGDGGGNVVRILLNVLVVRVVLVRKANSR